MRTLSRTCRTTRQRPSALRRGQSLVEFALVALVFYLLLAATLTFGHLLFVAQGIQQAADVTAREISRTPLPADGVTLTDLLDSTDAAQQALTSDQLSSFKQIYDEHYLVLNLDSLQGRSSLAELVADLPTANRQLVPMMIADTIEGTRVLRYPGAVFVDSDLSDNPTDPRPSGYLVRIPRVVSSGEGGETIELLPVVEESSTGENSRFPLGSGDGVVSLQINYPFQSSSMSSFRPNVAGPFEPTIGNPVVAGSVQVTNPDELPGELPGAQVLSDRDFGAYTGDYSLGQQAALGETLRPYRRILRMQATYRREIFSD